jgi:class 3 adenylate cyclase
MEPQVQYAKTSDGVSIAYAVFGNGTPLVLTAAVSGLGLHFYSFMSGSRLGVDTMVAKGFQVIRYDSRGTGSSDRAAQDFSLETMLLDLEAVVNQLGLDRFALHGHFVGARPAIAYAVRQPDRVTHLVLRDPHASAADENRSFPGQSIVKAMRPFAEEQWELVSINIAALGFGFSDLEAAKQYAEALRSGVTAETWLKFAEALDKIDVTDLLGSVSLPTLVIVDTSGSYTMSDSVDNVKSLAAKIPDARLVTTDDFAAAVKDFVSGVGSASDAEPTTSALGTFRTVLFTDLVGHTEMMTRLGDERGRDVLREHERIIRDVLSEHGGTEIKTMGDGFMASFGSITRAMDCAMGLQRSFAERNASSSEPLRVRVGLNAGEPIEEDGDLFGSTVILASRIAAKAGAGEILIPEPLRHLLTGKTYVYADRGETLLKGFEDAVRLFEVRWRDSDV